MQISGFRPEEVIEEPSYSQPKQDFRDGKLFQKYKRRVLDSDNDFIVVIAAASKSGVSGVGKTTLGVGLARYFDASTTGFSAEKKSTLDPETFSKGLLTNEEDVPNQSAIIFDEAQGTLSGSGVDSRRSMAQGVMDVTTALSTLRFRQNTAIIISQSTKWIDKRIDDLLDALVLIQDRDPFSGTVRAEVFETYYNDLSMSSKRYTEHMDSLTWPALPKDDPDYQFLHQLKADTAIGKGEQFGEDDEEDQSLPKETQIRIAQEMRNKGMEGKEIAASSLIDYSKSWVWKHTEAP